MLNLTEIKPGKKIILEGQPFTVLASQHSKTGRAGAVLRTKLKNLVNGDIIKKTFQGNEKFDEAALENKEAQYLYKDGESYFFMDGETYEQFEIPAKVVGNNELFLKEETAVAILYFQDQPINIELPIKMTFEVVDAPPAVKGNTADGGTKTVKLETGLSISTPLFIKTGDKVVVNTETGDYVSRE